MYETDRIPSSWVERLNGFDEICETQKIACKSFIISQTKKKGVPTNCRGLKNIV